MKTNISKASGIFLRRGSSFSSSFKDGPFRGIRTILWTGGSLHRARCVQMRFFEWDLRVESSVVSGCCEGIQFKRVTQSLALENGRPKEK